MSYFPVALLLCISLLHQEMLHSQQPHPLCLKQQVCAELSGRHQPQEHQREPYMFSTNSIDWQEHPFDQDMFLDDHLQAYDLLSQLPSFLLQARHLSPRYKKNIPQNFVSGYVSFPMPVFQQI
jgi:hypothetical protein